jgi:hypothetical protein
MVGFKDEGGTATLLKKKHIVSLPFDMSLPECLAVIRGICACPTVVGCVMTGNRFRTNRSNEADFESTVILEWAARLPYSNLVCLNLGEILHAGSSWIQLASAIATEQCILGHFYATENVLTPDLKNNVQEALKRNRRKQEYKTELVGSWGKGLKHGCHCWWNAGPQQYQRAVKDMSEPCRGSGAEAVMNLASSVTGTGVRRDRSRSPRRWPADFFKGRGVKKATGPIDLEDAAADP